MFCWFVTDDSGFRQNETTPTSSIGRRVTRDRLRDVVRSRNLSADLRFPGTTPGQTERSLGYRYDAELGWTPEPNSSSVVTNFRTIHVRHNSLGLRDDEISRDDKPVIMFLGDSFVWGLDFGGRRALFRPAQAEVGGPDDFGRGSFRLRQRPGISAASAAVAAGQSLGCRADLLLRQRSPR